MINLLDLYVLFMLIYHVNRLVWVSFIPKDLMRFISTLVIKGAHEHILYWSVYLNLLNNKKCQHLLFHSKRLDEVHLHSYHRRST